MASYQSQTAHEGISQIEWAIEDMEEKIDDLISEIGILEFENQQLKEFIHELTGVDDFSRLSVGQVLEIRQKVAS